MLGPVLHRAGQSPVYSYISQDVLWADDGGGPEEGGRSKRLSSAEHRDEAGAKQKVRELLSKAGVFCEQVAEEDLKRVAAATGGVVQSTVNNLDPKVLGTCAQFEEVQVSILLCLSVLGQCCGHDETPYGNCFH